MSFRGVHAQKGGGYVAKIGRKYLGYFREIEAAQAARKAAEVVASGAVFERQEIQVEGEIARLPLHGRRGKFHGWAVIDLADLAAVKDIAWTMDLRGYVVGRPPGFSNSVTLHRWLIHGGAKSSEATDHRDRDTLNNRRSNLRVCSAAENSRNTRLAKNNSSGVKGVRKAASGAWQARITYQRKEIHLGNFPTMGEAADAYAAAARRLHGEFASPV